MSVEWSGPARRAFNTYIDYLIEAAPRSAQRASREIAAATERIGRRPLIGRPSRWPGLREWSLRRWKKIVVYRVEAEQIVILALYDARQDLTRVTPKE
jgi:plasmid stabilization system protein ParE